MSRQRTLMAGGVISTAVAFACFTMMDGVPDRSPTQNALAFSGYLLVAIALVLLFLALLNRTS